MKCQATLLGKNTCENLLLFVPKNKKLLSSSALKAIHPKLPALLTAVQKEESFEGDAGRHIIYPGQQLGSIKRVIFVGCGDAKKETLSEAIAAQLGKAMTMLPKHKIYEVAFPADCYDLGKDTHEVYEHMVMQSLLGAYQFLTYKTKDVKSMQGMKQLHLLSEDAAMVKGLQKIAKKSMTINEYVTLARDLSNEPSHEASPAHMETRARSLAKRLGLKVTVLSTAQVQKKGMNLLYNVGKAAEEGPRLVHLSYTGAPSKKDSYGLVGKGITFDTGGTSLKPAAYMRHMKVDMTGSSTVLATICAVAALKMKVNVDAYLPLAENAIGSKAYKPDDVITAYNGLTVEIENTDAEGRLVLADALTYASEKKPTQMIDIGTLTGAAIYVTGGMAAPIMGTDETLVNDLKAASKATGEKVWELPLWDDFDVFIKSKVADVVNCYAGRAHPGSIACGAFLKQFVGKDIPWVHIDIAGVTLADDRPGAYSHGPSGFGVRLLTKWLEGKQ